MRTVSSKLLSNKFHHLFSFKGRIGRGEFAGVFITVIFLYLLVSRVALSAIDELELGYWFSLYFSVASTVAGTALVCTITKRLHDVDVTEYRPAGLAVISGVAVLLGIAFITPWHTLVLRSLHLFDVALIWPIGSLLYLGAARGNSKENKYGRPPTGG